MVCIEMIKLRTMCYMNTSQHKVMNLFFLKKTILYFHIIVFWVKELTSLVLLGQKGIHWGIQVCLVPDLQCLLSIVPSLTFLFLYFVFFFMTLVLFVFNVLFPSNFRMPEFRANEWINCLSFTISYTVP